MYFKLDSSTSKVIAKAACGKTPPGEIVLRAAHCNYLCIPCFAAGYSHADRVATRRSRDIFNATDVHNLINEFMDFKSSNVITEYLSSNELDSFNWLRVVGGEPIMNFNNLDFLKNFLLGISAESEFFKKRVIIQTNGSFLGSKEYAEVRNHFAGFEGFDGRIVFEISIKGGNENEFMITSRKESENYRYAYNCIQHFKRIHEDIPNVDFVAIAGFGPNIKFLSNRAQCNKITLYNPEDNKPFFHSSNWDEIFTDIRNTVTTKYTNFNGKMPMAGIEDIWQYGFPAIRLAKSLDGAHFYDSMHDPINNVLEDNMNEIRNNFFLTVPKTYYPSLF